MAIMSVYIRVDHAANPELKDMDSLLLNGSDPEPVQKQFCLQVGNVIHVHIV